MKTLRDAIQAMHPDLAFKVVGFESIEDAEKAGIITKREGTDLAIAIIVYRKCHLDTA